MGRNQRRRTIILEEVLKTLKENGNVEEKKFIAMLALKHELSSRTISQYIEILIDGELIKRTKDDIEHGSITFLSSK